MSSIFLSNPTPQQIPIYRAVSKRTNLTCHCEPVRTLAWQSPTDTLLLEIATPVTSVTGSQ